MNIVKIALERAAYELRLAKPGKGQDQADLDGALELVQQAQREAK